MKLTDKQKAAFQELAEWAARYDADIQADEVDIIIEDTAFVLNHCSNQGVFIDMPESELSFKARQQEGGK